MPLPKGTRYRVKTTKHGKKVRLAFKNGEVIEAKNIKTGATHTQGEFKKDRSEELKRKAKDRHGRCR
jgi:hypothetical protein